MCPRHCEGCGSRPGKNAPYRRGFEGRQHPHRGHETKLGQYSPKRQGDDYTTVLGNDMEYASYVNDGHRMDRHFVPGLVVNPYSGLLEYNPDGKGGIVVGIKTAYVPGVHMVDDAKGTYSQVLKKELKDIGEVFE